MNEKNAFGQLRNILADLYNEPSSIRRIVDDADMNSTSINFQGSTINIWHEVLKEAERQNKIESIVEVARNEYPAHQKLTQASTAYQPISTLPNQEYTSSPAHSSNSKAGQLQHDDVSHARPIGKPDESEVATLPSPSLPKQADPWQTYEREGDRLVKLAERADQEDTLELWQAAQRHYNRALGAQSRPGVLEMITLYRKTATVLRKQAKIDLAKSEYLDKGLSRIQTASNHSAPSSALLLEEALYQLEYANCDYKEEKWQELQRKTAKLIEHYKSDSILELHSDFLYIVGCAYNLRAIALEHLTIPESSPHNDATWCWQVAQSYLERANNEKSDDVLRDIKMNKASQLAEWGSCDSAIEIFEEILAHEKVRPSLPTERRIAAQQTLAVSYLDRLILGDIGKAQTLAHENLTWSKRQKHVREWVNALHLYLEVIKASIKAASHDNTQMFVEQAHKEYYAFQRSDKFGKAWETAPDAIELRRLLADIYTAANDLSKAAVEVKFIEAHRPKDEDRDEGDIYLTLAKFHHKKNEMTEAQVHLEEARKRFQSAQHWGLVVETDLQWVEVKVSQGKWEEARQLLEETLRIANGLACEARIERVTKCLRTLQKQ